MRPVFIDERSCTSPRIPASWAASHAIDKAAVSSLLVFGSILPPRSLFEGVSQQSDPASGTAAVEPEPDASPGGPEGLLKQFDLVLLDCMAGRSKPVVFFSGGVDSLFIADRLRALGFDCELVHLAFPDRKDERLIAEGLARELGCRLHVVEYAHDWQFSSLHEIYPQPFGDISSAPTAALVGQTIANDLFGGDIIFDGTGADGLLGLFARARHWERLHRAASPFQAIARRLYGRCWSSPGLRERTSRVLKKAACLPFPACLVAQNPLFGIAYPEIHLRDLASGLEAWVAQTLREHRVAADAAVIGAAADLLEICVGVFVQKSLPLCDRAGETIVYPFLDRRLTELVLRSSPGTHRKLDAKRVLKEHVSARYTNHDAHRRKVGFLGRRNAEIYTADFAQRLRASIEADGLFDGMADRQIVCRIAAGIADGREAPGPVENLAWTMVFADSWLRGLRSLTEGAGDSLEARPPKAGVAPGPPSPGRSETRPRAGMNEV